LLNLSSVPFLPAYSKANNIIWRLNLCNNQEIPSLMWKRSHEATLRSRYSPCLRALSQGWFMYAKIFSDWHLAFCSF
jgi:hypothetical protein